jgi:hypothetical protein
VVENQVTIPVDLSMAPQDGFIHLTLRDVDGIPKVAEILWLP